MPCLLWLMVTIPRFIPRPVTSMLRATLSKVWIYGDDSVAKVQMIATMLMQVGAITMLTDGLDKSISRLPERYPLTIYYYQLLFSGQLGFHLGAQFEERPSFWVSPLTMAMLMKVTRSSIILMLASMCAIILSRSRQPRNWKPCFCKVCICRRSIHSRPARRNP